MEFPHIAVLALLSLALVGSDASLSAEDYWQSIWPNTPIPKNLQNLLKPASEISLPTKVEDTQYPTTFFLENDIQAGRKMKLQFNKHSNAQPLGVIAYLNYKDNGASSETNVPREVQDTEYPSNFFFEGDLQPGKKMNLNFNKHSHAQPWGVVAWQKNKDNDDVPEKVEDTQYPTTFFFEQDLHPGKKMNLNFNKHSHSQPYGVVIWRKNEDNGATSETNVPVKVDDTQYPAAFFFEQDLQEGKKMNLHFNKHSHAQPWGVGSWAKDIDAKSIETKRFTLEELCENRPPIEGEDKICAKSLESLVDFAISKLGKDIEALSSSFVPHQEQYRILEGVQKVADEGVMCHRLNFKNSVFYCHQVNETNAYTVPMVAVDGTETKALAVCHHDTRGINADVLYRSLKVKPGTVPVCHFLGTKALLWVTKPNNKPYQAS